jgi:DNA-binding CsgD family transcriptional regulator
MNRRHPTRIVVRMQDARLRTEIVERLAGLPDVFVEEADGAGADDGAIEKIEDVGSTQGLTPREVEVLGLLAEGLANKEIAARLLVSTHTAKFHVESLMHKLEAANRAQAVKEGIRLGLIGV